MKTTRKLYCSVVWWRQYVVKCNPEKSCHIHQMPGENCHMMKIQYSAVLKQEVNITILSMNNTPLIDPLLVLPTVSSLAAAAMFAASSDCSWLAYRWLPRSPATALLIIGISFVLMVRWSGIICEALHNINQWPRRNIYISSESNKQAQWHSAVHHSASAFHYSTSRFIYINTEHCIALLHCDFKKKRIQYFYFLDQCLYLKAFFFLMNKKMSETSWYNIYNTITITFVRPPSGRQRSWGQVVGIIILFVSAVSGCSSSGGGVELKMTKLVLIISPPPPRRPGLAWTVCVPVSRRLRPAARPHQDNASPAKTEIARPAAAPWRQLCWRHGAGTYFTCYDNSGLLLRRYINRYDWFEDVYKNLVLIHAQDLNILNFTDIYTQCCFVSPTLLNRTFNMCTCT